MNWIESSRIAAVAAPGAVSANDESLPSETRPAGWNPYDVWLKQVRAPRVRVDRPDAATKA